MASTAHDWFPTDGPILPHERQALAFLDSNGPHAVGVIDSEEKFAAAFVFHGLLQRGLIIADVGADNQRTYRLTTRGRSAIVTGT